MAQKGTVSIEKTGEVFSGVNISGVENADVIYQPDGKVEGFTFRVTGVNGYDRSFTTDKNGEIIIEGLRIGDYTISEVQDKLRRGYERGKKKNR